MTTRRESYLRVAAAIGKETEAQTRQALARQVDLGRKADMVLHHEGWQMFADLLTTRLDTLARLRQGVVDKLASDDTLGEALVALKLQLRSLDGEIKGCREALNLIPQVVEAGRQADGAR